jgi:hypothetical protein
MDLGSFARGPGRPKLMVERARKRPDSGFARELLNAQKILKYLQVRSSLPDRIL